MIPEFKLFPYTDNIITLYRGGSEAHGAKLDGVSDEDWCGVFIEPPEKIIGIDTYEHYVSLPPGAPGETKVDVCLYSLRKWANLAAKGNPSSLHYLFAPKTVEKIWWTFIDIHRDKFLSRGHIRPFLGFADAQLKRLFGEKGQKNCHRADIEEKFGYDTKYAMHIIRLFGEAKELMETGKITLPRPNAKELIDIRLGKYKLTEIRTWARQLEAEALEASDKSPLPARIDRDAISKIIASQYRDFWATTERREYET